MILSCVYILDDDVVCACFFAVAYFVGLVGKGERDDETKLGVVKKCCATCLEKIKSSNLSIGTKGSANSANSYICY